MSAAVNSAEGTSLARSATQDLDVVTGAFGYTGKYITRRLLNAGRRVRTITGHPNRPNCFGDQVETAPMNFSDRAGLIRTLQGASTLFNTYWVRFNHGRATFDEAIANSRILVQAAKEAGVRRIVHLSIANPSLASHLPYYSGKALVEEAIRDSGLSYAILRPTVIFGQRPGGKQFDPRRGWPGSLYIRGLGQTNRESRLRQAKIHSCKPARRSANASLRRAHCWRRGSHT